MRLAHHIIWEEVHGPIPLGYELHHLDQNKKNNDIENLVCLSLSDHHRIHSPHLCLLNGEWMRICKECRTAIPMKKCSRSRTFCDPCRARIARIYRRAKKLKT